MATPTIVRIGGIKRQDGLQVPFVHTPPQWFDSFILAFGVAETYTLPVDAAGNRATILRLSASTSASLFGKWDGTASLPGDTSDGTASFCIPAFLQPRILVAPNSAYTLSLIATLAAGNVVTIEAWS